MLDFLEFIKNPQTQASVVCFSHKAYPALFFSHFHRAVRTLHTVQTIDTANRTVAEIQTQCSMSFLGEQYSMWLGNLSELDTKKQQQLLEYCAAYKGPHTLWFYVNDQADVLPELSGQNRQIIKLPETITLHEYQMLCAAWYPAIARSADSFKDLFIQAAVDLEFASMILQYHTVLGRQVDLFVDQWANKLREPEQSLFTLTTYFFAKQVTPFLRLWKTIEPEYPAVFWSTFWSEQLFRAACVSEALKANNHQLAKKMAYRLPFSFMQKDYKRVTLSELQQAHQFMYEYDVHVKNNGTPEFLDIMFSTFFMHTNIRP